MRDHKFVVVCEGHEGLNEELHLKDGRWSHFMPPDWLKLYELERDVERPITPTKARELVTKAKQRALRCLAAIRGEIAQCDEFEWLLNRQL